MRNFRNLCGSIGKFVLVLLCIHFTVKRAVKKGLSEYFRKNKS
jgi:hypothetical protein